MLLGFAHAQAGNWNAIHNSDTALFEQAQKAFSESNFVEARTLLRALIDSHPDSDFVPRAKLLIADSWYSERAFKQAELEYQDFITFFPNRPEVAEARRRVNFIRKDASF
jgi:outer membrane protein assembly factor BamD